MSKALKAEDNGTLAIPGNKFGNIDELEERVKSLMEKGQKNHNDRKEKSFICKVCGKEGLAWNIKDHIEANHLDGIALPCNHCDRTFR